MSVSASASGGEPRERADCVSEEVITGVCAATLKSPARKRQSRAICAFNFPDAFFVWCLRCANRSAIAHDEERQLGLSRMGVTVAVRETARRDVLEEDVSVGELTRPRLHTHAWGSRELIARGPCAVARPWDCAAAWRCRRRRGVPSASGQRAADPPELRE